MYEISMLVPTKIISSCGTIKPLIIYQGKDAYQGSTATAKTPDTDTDQSYAVKSQSPYD